MDIAVKKVTAFVTRERSGAKELLVFKHPSAGIQIPAGTVEDGESLETGVMREVYEETGLKRVKIEKCLGCIQNELGENERVVSKTTQVYNKPRLNSSVCKEELARGLTVNYNATHGDFTHISYIEYDRIPNPTCVHYEITGWVPSRNLSLQKARHFFQLSTPEETADGWEVKSDRDHIFKVYWTPLSPKPRIVPPQDKWLDFVYEQIQ